MRKIFYLIFVLLFSTAGTANANIFNNFADLNSCISGYKNFSDYKFSVGGNIQYSNYSNNTLYPFYEINYNTSFDLIKYGFFAKSNRRFFDDRLGVSLGIRVDQDNFTVDNNLLKNFSPRMALSWSISKDNRWKLNFATGRYFKIPTYTI